ncbi:MAG TPA: malate dehydrogenase [Thermoanaerobaculia bacterium]|nr:malate dehydrogenase [Thermoanaerobaculia bacterium]HUM28991.1 malate dehydrogenase [Thermoanaerobaculia bacterium]HXK67453.1 malate dehydrogenase [Thermoanaerobaculia bacterium]
MRKKVTVVGAGHVGEHVAYRVAELNLADVVLIDIVDGMPQGKALDQQQAAPVLGFHPRLRGTNSYEDTAGSSIVVITAGIPRKPGMSRDDLVATNEKVVATVTEEIMKWSKDAILILVTNPLDAMCEVARRVSKLPRERCFGMAGILDTARMRAFIAMELDCSVNDVQAFVLGGHGDTMVPLVRYTSVAGIPISELIPQERIDAIVERTAKGGGEIVALLKTGSAYYAPAAGAAEMVEAILRDTKVIRPCSAYLEGEYGIRGQYLGVPVKLGAKGIEKIMEIKLTPEENARLEKSAEAVRSIVEILKV